MEQMSQALPFLSFCWTFTPGCFLLAQHSGLHLSSVSVSGRYGLSSQPLGAHSVSVLPLMKIFSNSKYLQDFP